MASMTISVPVPGSTARWLAAGVAAGVLLATLARPAFAPPAILAADPAVEPQHTISVSGTGKVLVSPDIADLRLGVSTTKPTVKEARAVAATAMSGVLGALRALGIADADVQTSLLSLQPVYDYSTSGSAPRLTGYNLSNMIVATIRDLDVVGAAIDDAIAAGATTMQGVTFRVADPAGAEEQARRAAMAQAKSKAQTLATAAGVSLVGVASISETSSAIPYPQVYAGAAPAAKDVATPIEPGTNEVAVSVSVIYLIP